VFTYIARICCRKDWRVDEVKQEAAVRELLVANAIRLIAAGGFEKATTKELALSGGHLPDLKMNEVYIYRFYGSKERLFESVFFQLDSELFFAIRNEAQIIGGFDKDTREQFRKLFDKVWQFILGNEARCRCYIRYYYSVYFKGSSLESHKRLFEDVVKGLTPIFKEEADVQSILHSVFTALLDFAIRVCNGDLEDSEENRAHIFNVLYCMMSSYLKEPKPYNVNSFYSKSV
jgi:AcrR family transcriptional regulator